MFKSFHALIEKHFLDYERVNLHDCAIIIINMLLENDLKTTVLSFVAIIFETIYWLAKCVVVTGLLVINIFQAHLKK